MNLENPEIFFFSENTSYRIRSKKKIRTWIVSVILQEKKSLSSLNIILCDDDFLLEMNKKHLSHDYYTDIITFHYSDDPIEGEIYISIERVKENARSFQKKLAEELHRVIIHGVLHLCGYKDGRRDEKFQMRQMEDKYLQEYSRV